MEKENIKKAFLVSTGNLIARKRKYKNITQKELGEELGVSASTISKYEHGSMEMPLFNLPVISSFCSFPMKEYVSEWEHFDIDKFVTELLTTDNLTPDKDIVKQYIVTCSENEIQDLKQINQSINNLKDKKTCKSYISISSHKSH